MAELFKIEGLVGGVSDFLGKNSVTIDEKRRRAVLEKYQKLAESKEVFATTFVAVYKNSPFREEDGVKIFVPAKEFERKRNRNARVDYPYQVRVASVDDEKSEVVLELASVKDSQLIIAVNAIDAALAEGKEVRMNCRVEAVDAGSRRVIVDIGGLGIVGYIGIADWSQVKVTPGYLFASAKRGFIETVIVKRKVERDDGDFAYICSRREALDEDAWKGISERYPEGTFVNVTCVTIRKGDGEFAAPKNWFGIIDGLRDIMVYGVTPKKDSDVVIREGGKYHCIVSRSRDGADNPKGGTLRVYAVAEVKE